MYWEQVLADLLMERRGRQPSFRAWHQFPAAGNVYINRQPDNQVYEFENLEELRVFDEQLPESIPTMSAMELVAEVLHVPESEVTGI